MVHLSGLVAFFVFLVSRVTKTKVRNNGPGTCYLSSGLYFNIDFNLLGMVPSDICNGQDIF